MSHPISLHTAGQLERALDAYLQRVAARGAKGWMKRIVAFFFCRYCEAVIELLEGLLAEYRAGTLVLPGRPYDQPAGPADSATAERPAQPRSRGPAVRRMPAPQSAPASNPGDAPAVSIEQSAAVAPMPPRFARTPLHLPIRLPEHGPLGVAGYPSHVPRWPVAGFGDGNPTRRTSKSLRNRNERLFESECEAARPSTLRDLSELAKLHPGGSADQHADR